MAKQNPPQEPDYGVVLSFPVQSEVGLTNPCVPPERISVYKITIKNVKQNTLSDLQSKTKTLVFGPRGRPALPGAKDDRESGRMP